MKRTIVLLGAALLLACSASAQKLKSAQVPAAVVAGFNQHFTQAKEVKWEKEGEQYEAEFEQGKTEWSALLSAGGQLLETETELPVGQLPVPVRATLASRYKGCKITEAAKIVAAGTGVITYEAEIVKNGKKQDVLFDAQGQEVKK